MLKACSGEMRFCTSIVYSICMHLVQIVLLYKVVELLYEMSFYVFSLL